MVRRLAVALLSLGMSFSLFAQRLPKKPAAPQPPAFGQSHRGLTSTQTSVFGDGKEEFVSVETVDDGLGPVFNGRSCGECHNVPVAGGGSERTVTRIATRISGVFDALTSFGGSLLQDHAIGFADGSPHEFNAEVVPPDATIVAHRRSTPLFGLGLVEATPDATFIALAQRPGATGRVAMVDNAAAGMKTVGKFGWKAQVPALLQFSGDAYLNEMGITSPAFPNENCPRGDCNELQFNPLPGLNDGGEDVELLADFMTLLAPPPRGAVNQNVRDGERVFDRIGCNSCHVATLQTGANPIASLNRVTYHPYSDFLLHDMGALGDGIEQGAANGREIRTAPLWGLRVITKFLHDGRASTLEGAITAHDGQGRGARDRYNALTAVDKARLLAFLKSL